MALVHCYDESFCMDSLKIISLQNSLSTFINNSMLTEFCNGMSERGHNLWLQGKTVIPGWIKITKLQHSCDDFLLLVIEMFL